MSFAVWFILLTVISLGIGALIRPWLESSAFKFAFFPGMCLSGICRLGGARLAGLPITQRRVLTGKGRGVRVDTTKAPWHKLLILSTVSFLGPLAVIVVANALLGWPLNLTKHLPTLHLDSRLVYDLPNLTGTFLYEIWIFLRYTGPRDPVSFLWVYVLVGVLLSNAPAKGESVPLWTGVLLLGLLDFIGLTIRRGSKSFLAYELFWAGLSLVIAFSLLTLLIAIILSAVERARASGQAERRGS